jgi:hypothetical protein
MVVCCSGATCKLVQHDIVTLRPHKCRQCKQIMHGTLCSAHPQEEVFVCFPCYHDNEQATAATTTTTTTINNNERGRATGNNNTKIYGSGNGTATRRSGNDNRQNDRPRPPRPPSHLPLAAICSRTRSLPNPRRQQPPEEAQVTPRPARRQAPQVVTHPETPIFRIGDMVDIDARDIRKEGGRAYITGTSCTPGGSVGYDARYVEQKTKMTPNVREERLHPCVLGTTSRRRNSEAAASPSLLPVHYERPERVSTTTSQRAEATVPKKPHVQRLLQETNQWNKRGQNVRGDHSITKYLKNKKGDEKNGCVRNEQAKAEGRKTDKQLSAYEWELCLKMWEAMESAGNLTSTQ